MGGLWVIEDLAYMAGLIDADGSVVFTRTKRSDSRVGVRFRPLLELENKSPVLPRWIHAAFGGHLLRYEKQSQFKRQVIWRWQLVGARAVELLEALQPFLRLKKKRACILIANKPLIFNRTRLTLERIRALNNVHKQMWEGHK